MNPEPTKDQVFAYLTGPGMNEVLPEDDAFYLDATNGLPNLQHGEPFHCGPHNIPSFRACYNQVKPDVLLQIGFNLGHSTAFWFALGVRHILSIDIRLDARVQMGLDAINKRWPNRHSFIHASSTYANLPKGFKGDLIFIDGGHDYPDVRNDIEVGRRAQCPLFFFDDWYPGYGPGTQSAITDAKLVPVALWGNMALCREQRKDAIRR